MVNHSHTATRDDDGASARLAEVTCTRCGNGWFVKVMSENEPSYCCYCGAKFHHYVDEEGVVRNLAGLPLRKKGESHA
jgi:hypothetical protein